MRVEELRESEHVESVESAKRTKYSNEQWKVSPNHDSYNKQGGIKFLCSLNVRREDNGVLWVPKGDILRG